MAAAPAAPNNHDAECKRADSYLKEKYDTVFGTIKNQHIRKFDSMINKNKVETTDRQTTVDKSKWVINASKRPLSSNETSLLARGLNFAITPQRNPTKEIIVNTELACIHLQDPVKAQELRADVTKILAKSKAPKSNITKGERAALFDLKKDKTITILPADKGRATVILDTEEYKTKMKALLADTETYEVLKKDPTSKYQAKLVELLRSWQRDPNTSIPLPLYRKIYPTEAEPPKMYGQPKIHKPDRPLRPIVSGVGSLTHPAARAIADILSPLVGKTPHHIINSTDFVSKIKDLEVTPGQKIISYDVSALFTSIPIPKAIEATNTLLQADNTLADRTPLSIKQILDLLEFCLGSTYFVYDGTFYRQKQGAAMGSPVSPIVANIYMESFEKKALETASSPPSTWLRYVDDTFVVIHEYEIDNFTRHINGQDPHIRFTSEEEVEGSIPFLDVRVHLTEDGTLKTTVYRKPTHTDQYLNWASNHHLSHKRSVVRTLLHRVDQVVSEPEDRTKEITHVKGALKDNEYPDWSFVVPKPKDKTNNTTGTGTKNIRVSIPYTQDLSEKLERTYRKHGIATTHKPFNTLRNSLVNPKDKTPNCNKCGVVYEITCADCTQTYVGETARSLGKRLKEHHRTRGEANVITAVGEHCKDTGHNFIDSDTTIISRQSAFWQRKIDEAIEIRARIPTMNRDRGYDLPPIYESVISRDLIPRSRDQ